jgi:RNA polymerase primary sigma factor
MDMEDKGIKIYLREIGQTPLLTIKQEGQLAKRIKRGDEEARQLMIRSNLRLVVKIAHDYAQFGLPLLDLISEGNIGLMKAVVRFDPRKGGKLSTYAAWWIKQAIKRALANQSKTIRLPAHLVDKISKMRRMQRTLTQKTGREPSNEEVAKKLGVPAATIAQWQVLSLKPTSLDAPIGDDSGSDFSDIIGDEKSRLPFDDINDRQLREEIESLMDSLSRRERDILKYRYGLRGVQTETLEVVGKRFDITRERVRQIQNAAVAKLRDMMEERAQPRLPGKAKKETGA